MLILDIKASLQKVPKIRTITNTIIETQQSFTHYKKDMDGLHYVGLYISDSIYTSLK